MNKFEKDYIPADKFVVLNDNDPDLRQIVLKLPKPPQLKYIEGYGKYFKDQRFERLTIPRRLIDLEAEAIEETKRKMSSNINNVVTLLKIQKTFWGMLIDRGKEYKKEIEFIRRVWWHRINGYWFFNRGKPVYISGWHFFFLNFYTMDTSDGTSRPEYRDRDRKEFLFFNYQYTTNETFAKLDNEGHAIKEDDGSYLMKELFNNDGSILRICFGNIQPKNRRSGNTNKSLSIGLEIVSRTIGSDGGGIQSYSENNAESHFKDKLLPAFEKLPLWLKPNSTSGKTADTLKFQSGKNDFDEPSLGTKIDYATTASSKYYDGKKLMFILVDESGKTHNVSVLERHDVNIPTLAQGDGRIIHGYYTAPSTVSEMADGSFDYRHLAETSNFYCRVPSTHQTFSGLFRLFVPASEGLDGFIDSYGYSVKDEILPYQREEGFQQTALEYLRGKRDILLSKGDPESMRAYREAKKLFPLQYSDCFLGESGDIGFPMEIIDTRLAELRRQDDTVRGNLVWKNEFGGDVEFIPDAENGRFLISQFPIEGVSNRKTQVNRYSTIEGKDIPMWRPLVADKYVLGCDPIKFASKQDAKVGASIGKRSKLSDGGIAVLLKYDKSIDGDKKMEDWKTHKFVASYRYRPANSIEYSEDVLKCSIFYGAMCYPETNIDTILKYFIEKEYEGYLLYDIDVTTGKYKPKAGCDSLERSKQKLFSRLRDYLEFRGHQEDFAPFLQECKDIKGMEMMRHFDRLTSHGMCLLGAESPFVEENYSEEESEFDAGDFWDFS
jgi:hypothetical protein